MLAGLSTKVPKLKKCPYKRCIKDILAFLAYCSSQGTSRLCVRASVQVEMRDHRLMIKIIHQRIKIMILVLGTVIGGGAKGDAP